MVCHLGHVRTWSGGAVHYRQPSADVQRDPFLGLPLWLQTNCAGHVLWAYNARHVAHLRGYVAADLRERGLSRPDPSTYCGASMIDRLPAWMKASAHRSRVLRALDRLAAAAARPTP
ncbi:hypothetical protein ACFY12_32215 [Streptomyces sp. NPDC001339]|uniref:hypothetical protein n=1 Tax=Streptomyces sp. NPDC001339 TaxID=3364563 RepID=UPI0036CAB629